MKLSEEMLAALTRELIDKGKLVEAGWIGLRLTALSPGMSQAQIAMMRDCFFAGAQHLMASVMSAIDDADEEPTDDDLRRMDMIHKELENFLEDFKKRHRIEN
jgi:hypothetical protein